MSRSNSNISSCSVSLWKQAWAHAPLLFRAGGGEVVPQVVGRGQALVKVGRGERITLACPGGGVGGTGREEAQVGQYGLLY